MNIWLTTDTHFKHKMLVREKYRPEDFELRIMHHICNMVKPDDILIHLGDVCMGNDLEVHSFFNYPLRKWLIRGNHDSKSDHWYLNHGWEFVGRMVVNKWFGKKVCLSHAPVADFGFDINIHGHFHDNAHRSSEPEFQAIYGPKHKLIALEYTDYKPVLLESVIVKFSAPVV
jgi:calcineurin-like phosphoesterase family protein